MLSNNLPYLVLILLYFILFYIELRLPQQRNKISQICFIIYLFFFGFRGLIGTDWYNYQIEYDFLGNSMSYTSTLEQGFQFIVYICNSIGLSYYNFVFVITTLQSVLLYKILDYHAKYISLSYIILIAIFPIVIVDLLRNFTSLLIVMSGLPYLLRNRKGVFVGYILLGMTFHTSAIVFGVLFFIKNKLLAKKVIIYLSIIGSLVYIFQINFYKDLLLLIGAMTGGRIEYLIEQTTGKEEVAYGISVGIIEKFIILYLIIKNYNKVKMSNVLWVNCLLIYVFVNLYFNTSQSFVNRFATLFMFGYIFILNDFMYYYKSKFNVNFSLIAICSFLILRTFLGYSGDIYNYSNSLLGDDNWNVRYGTRESHYLDRK
ncbi:EpsG family protein [Myroides odoratimimus]|uniref:EpsG family protein n=1 Tax=Myroides odoratimimus TaxID=76832 RepID=UPI002DC05BAB|nr:EpsG family protein [Myroides odoratimimus]MEC4086897.1 EpsG family protein [Myroides odoratimimus]